MAYVVTVIFLNIYYKLMMYDDHLNYKSLVFLLAVLINKYVYKGVRVRATKISTPLLKVCQNWYCATCLIYFTCATL